MDGPGLFKRAILILYIALLLPTFLFTLLQPTSSTIKFLNFAWCKLPKGYCVCTMLEPGTISSTPSPSAPPVVQEVSHGWSKEALLALLALLAMTLLPAITYAVRQHWSLVKEFYRTKFGREADNVDGARDLEEAVLLVPLIFERGAEADQLDAITTSY